MTTPAPPTLRRARARPGRLGRLVAQLVPSPAPGRRTPRSPRHAPRVRQPRGSPAGGSPERARAVAPSRAAERRRTALRRTPERRHGMDAQPADRRNRHDRETAACRSSTDLGISTP